MALSFGSALPLYSKISVVPEKSGFYEQVMFVKGFFPFSLHRAFVSVFVVTHVVLHRVSIRTLSERL
jgi:riboflavin transporter FmnP